MQEFVVFLNFDQYCDRKVDSRLSLLDDFSQLFSLPFRHLLDGLSQMPLEGCLLTQQADEASVRSTALLETDEIGSF